MYNILCVFQQIILSLLTLFHTGLGGGGGSYTAPLTSDADFTLIIWPILVSFWSVAKERNRFFFPQLIIQRFWGTGDPVPKIFSYSADISSCSRNVTFQIDSELFKLWVTYNVNDEYDTAVLHI